MARGRNSEWARLAMSNIVCKKCMNMLCFKMTYFQEFFQRVFFSLSSYVSLIDYEVINTIVDYKNIVKLMLFEKSFVK